MIASVSMLPHRKYRMLMTHGNARLCILMRCRRGQRHPLNEPAIAPRLARERPDAIRTPITNGSVFGRSLLPKRSDHPVRRVEVSCSGFPVHPGPGAVAAPALVTHKGPGPSPARSADGPLGGTAPPWGPGPIVECEASPPIPLAPSAGFARHGS